MTYIESICADESYLVRYMIRSPTRLCVLDYNNGVLERGIYAETRNPHSVCMSHKEGLKRHTGGIASAFSSCYCRPSKDITCEKPLTYNTSTLLRDYDIRIAYFIALICEGLVDNVPGNSMYLKMISVDMHAKTCADTRRLIINFIRTTSARSLQ